MKITIEVDQVVTAAVDILANAGDKLMIRDGACIGVIPADGFEQKPDSKTPAPGRTFSDDEIWGFFRQFGATRARALNNRLNLNGTQREYVKRSIARLVKRGLLATVSKTRFPEYVAVEAKEG